MAVSVLALDLATRTGWAHSAGESGVVNFGPFGPLPRRLVAFRDWLGNLLDHMPADWLVFEEAHHRGGAATRSGVGMQTVVLLVAADHDAEVACVHSLTLKKHATGSGRASKDQMLAAAMRRCPTIRFADDNHVDAVWLLDLAISYPASLRPV